MLYFFSWVDTQERNAHAEPNRLGRWSESYHGAHSGDCNCCSPPIPPLIRRTPLPRSTTLVDAGFFYATKHCLKQKQFCLSQNCFCNHCTLLYPIVLVHRDLRINLFSCLNRHRNCNQKTRTTDTQILTSSNTLHN